MAYACRCLQLALRHAHGGQMDLPSALRRPQSSFEGALICSEAALHPPPQRGCPLLFELQNPVLPTKIPLPPYPLFPPFACGLRDPANQTRKVHAGREAVLVQGHREVACFLAGIGLREVHHLRADGCRLHS